LKSASYPAVIFWEYKESVNQKNKAFKNEGF